MIEQTKKMKKNCFRFYSKESSKRVQGEKEVFGQTAIHHQFIEEDFKNCRGELHHIKSMWGSNQEVVVQVSGYLSNNGAEMRRFEQTCILVPKVMKKIL